MKPGIKVTLLIAIVLLLDQWLKFHIKLNYEYGQETHIFGEGVNWAYLKFVENEGMAFGITFGWEYGKLLLSLFRIFMVAGLIWYMRLLIQERAAAGFLYSVGLITAGAVGNIIDSAFYGLIFTESLIHSDGQVAELVPFGQGYGTFLHGKVVDMLYFPMHTFHAPDWLPVFGGEDFLFFSPIFNIADASITCGVLSILIFQKWFFHEPKDEPNPPTLGNVQPKNPETIFTESVSVAATIAGLDTESETAGTTDQAEKPADTTMLA
ncbi:MAG: lipoprotein signal peptidase [Saprospiraceae bacterium]